jgi:sec-independent protein translocase protein TatB
MFDIGWMELLVIGVVALIVVGPKDLPKMFRTLGQMTAKARNMAREFQRAMEDAADATGVKDVARDLKGMTDPKSMGLDALKDVARWDPLKSDPATPKPKAPADLAPTQAPTDDDIDAAAAQVASTRNRGRATPVADPAPATDTPASPPDAPKP